MEMNLTHHFVETLFPSGILVRLKRISDALLTALEIDYENDPISNLCAAFIIMKEPLKEYVHYANNYHKAYDKLSKELEKKIKN